MFHKDADYAAFIRLFDQAHERWQGRFKAFPIVENGHLLTVLRYVERNPLRAGLATNLSTWPWTSLALFDQNERPPWFSLGPVARGKDWLQYVAQPQTDIELAALRRSVQRGCPYGSERWQTRTTAALGLESTLRPRDRPRRQNNEA